MERIWNKHKQSNNTPLKRKVFVGLSGGVDSSVSAALLKKAGYDVTGVFIKVWQPDFLPCSWREERRDAMRVAAKLGIPFLTFDFESEYKKDVVDYMIREYRAGRTPNPDVMCNKYVKFGAFFKKARLMGADYVATGHYARIRKTCSAKRVTQKMLRVISYKLQIAADSTKDQSYFLWTLNQEILSHTLFPIGNYKKSEVRKLAKKFKLFTSDKKDSQGLCFVGKLDMTEFLSNYIKPRRGDVLNKKGEVIGFHGGAPFFTPGERRGFETTKKSPHDNALFVLSKNIKKNTITVGSARDLNKNVSRQQVIVSKTNWITKRWPTTGKRYGALVRYRAEILPCLIKKNTSKQTVVFFPHKNTVVAPGQSMVLYDDDVCLGGGIIN